MKSITLNNRTYEFVSSFQHESTLRASFNQLTKTTFHFDFEDWYASGYWGDQYIPYSLVHNQQIVANVSVNTMDFVMNHEAKKAIQLGTVMTAQAYRHQGLSQFLMEQVISEWKAQVDLIYLFANDAVLDFYPKFNFEQATEYQCTKEVSVKEKAALYRKLDIEHEHDRALLIYTIETSIPMAKLAMRNNLSLIMFYCLSIHKNSIYYIEELNTIAVADITGKTIYLHDVFSKEVVQLDQIIEALTHHTTHQVVLGFTPLDESSYERNVLKQEGTTLFILKDQLTDFSKHAWRFPALSHA